MKHISFRKLLPWLAIAAVIMVAVYRLKFAATPVVAHVVQQADVVAEVMGTGTLEARIKTTISPRIQERLAEVLVDQGDFVSADQLLARLDDGELKRQVEVPEATLASAQRTFRVIHEEAVVGFSWSLVPVTRRFARSLLHISAAPQPSVHCHCSGCFLNNGSGNCGGGNTTGSPPGRATQTAPATIAGRTKAEFSVWSADHGLCERCLATYQAGASLGELADHTARPLQQHGAAK